MELIFKGLPKDIERFFNEILYPVIRQRQDETQGHYFRITEDKGDYYSRDPKAGNKVRRIKGYFPGEYYPVDFYEGKYDTGKIYKVNEDGLIEERPKDPDGSEEKEIRFQILKKDEEA